MSGVVGGPRVLGPGEVGYGGQVGVLMHHQASFMVQKTLFVQMCTIRGPGLQSKMILFVSRVWGALKRRGLC